MIEERIKHNTPLAPYTSFHIGGPALFFVEVNSKEELVAAIDWSKSKHLPHFILGGGSNLLISDQGYPGLVIHLLNENLDLSDQIITAGAGLSLASLVNFSIASNLAGLVWASGIPGTVGGAVRGNAGAYGGEVKDNLSEAEYYDIKTGTFTTITNQDCLFTYRSSFFKHDTTKIIWQAKFSLSPGDKQELSEQSLAIITQRQGKLPPEASAGSIFKNLIINQITKPSQATQDLISKTDIKGGKLATGSVIDQLNLRGTEIGGASISTRHANVIINHNQAQASDVLSLINLIKAQVKERFDLDLEEEISCLGF